MPWRLTFIYTPGTEEYLANEETKKMVISKIALGRIGEVLKMSANACFVSGFASCCINHRHYADD